MHEPEPILPPPRSDGSTATMVAVSVVLSLIGAAGVHLILDAVLPKPARDGGADAQRAERVVVPDLVGLKPAAARREVLNTGLLLRIEGQLPARGIDAAVIATQSPLGGSLLRLDDSMSVTLQGTGAAPAAVHPAPVATPAPAPALAAAVGVPALVGATVADAKARLSGAKLRLGTVTKQASKQPAGTIVAQTPKAGTHVEPNTAVDIVASDGPGEVAVPNLDGMSVPDATQQLTGVGLKLGAATQQPSDAPEGIVLSQTPAAGQKAAPGSAVAIVVAAASKHVKVPQVRMSRITEAREKLEAAGLKVRVREQFHPSFGTGVVFKQRPKAGDKVDRGTVITLSVVE